MRRCGHVVHEHTPLAVVGSKGAVKARMRTDTLAAHAPEGHEVAARTVALVEAGRLRVADDSALRITFGFTASPLDSVRAAAVAADAAARPTVPGAR